VNPRVLLWLKANGLTPDSIARRSGEDVRQVVIDGHRNLWTVHYIAWIDRRWREWAASLGFNTQRDAVLSGHTHDEFDAWLERKVQSQ
jgi:hypothetical protein